MQSHTIKVPNLIEILKGFDLKVNPNYEEFLKSSDSFIKKFGGKYTEQFMIEDRPLFYAMTCPTATIENLQLGADLWDCLWLYDDIADEDAFKSYEIGKNLLKIIDNLELEPDFLLGQATKDIFCRLKSSSSPSDYQTISSMVKVLVTSLLKEAERRQKGEILSVDEYLKDRNECSGVEAFLLTCKIAEKVEYGKELLESENFQNFEKAFMLGFWVSNDIYSFRKEFEKNAHDTNLITVLMKEKKLSYQEAFDEAGRMYKNYIDFFIKSEQKLLEEMSDENTKRVVEFFKSHLRGYMEWHIVSKRYISDESFKENHTITIMQ